VGGGWFPRAPALGWVWGGGGGAGGNRAGHLNNSPWIFMDIYGYK